MNSINILIKPLITEKSTQKNLGSNRVVFKVATSANKYQIKAAVQKAFSVTVIKVNTSIVSGKTRRVGNKRLKQTSKGWKKRRLFS